jgi:hypothetical protein
MLAASAGAPETRDALRQAFEKAADEFTNGKRPGVRLRGGRQAAETAERG